MTEPDTRPFIRVTAGIILSEHGDYLLSSRLKGKPYVGYWEFAGGKVETDETEFQALQREFEEKLDIHICRAVPWLTKVHSYEHTRVRLRFMRAEAGWWTGELQAREGRAWPWQKTDGFTVSPMLPASGPLLRILPVPRSFTGRSDTGLEGEDTSGAYRVVPFGPTEPQRRHILIDETVLRTRGMIPEAENMWVRIQTASQWPHVQDADMAL